MEMVSLYLIAANVAGFALMALDKFLAQTHSRRVPERTLFGVALLGGVALVALYSFLLWKGVVR